MATLKSLKIDDTGNLTPPAGNSSNRPSITETVESFTTVGSTTWTCPAGVTEVQALVVAGGGGGGSRHGGGGGAGGVVYHSNYTVVSGRSYTVTVGGGGAGAIAGGSTSGSNGSNSVFDSLTAVGGGFGTSSSTSTRTDIIAGSGGSGGGARGNSPNTGGNGTPGQGHKGGNGGLQSTYDNPEGMGGGGGGAGGAGYAGTLKRGIRGNGGPGLAFSISGTAQFYAGGGGAGCECSYGNFTSGGIGGGGNGGQTSGSGDAGGANTGGGGGAGGHTDATVGNQAGGNGGSGVVILRYSATDLDDNPTGKIRWNSNNQNVEVYGVNDKWHNPADSTQGLLTGGLVMNLDAANYGSGTSWMDSSGNGFDATVYGSNVYTTANGGKFDFGTVAQSSNYIAINSDAAQLTSGAYTIEWWMQPKDSTDGARTRYWHSMANASTDNYNIIAQSNGGSMAHYTGGGSISYTDGEIMHFAISRSQNGEARYYKNGVQVSLGSNWPTINAVADGGWILNQEQDAVGGGFEPSQAYAGSFMQVRLYGVALDTDQIIHNYNVSCERYDLPKTPDEVGYTKRGIMFNLDASNPACFQETRSTWFDTSGRGNHANLANTYGYTHGADGFFKSAVATVPGISLVEELTLECLFRTTSGDPQTTYSRIMDRGDTTMSLGTYNSYEFRNWVYTAGGRTSELSYGSAISNDGLWHHAVMTYDGTWFKLYVDGVCVGRTSRTGDLETSQGTTVGNGDGNSFGGDIAIARQYRYALRPDEVRYNYEEMKKRYNI